MKTPTVSLCMIVRDEEQNLPAAIKSVAHLVEEIIVCDTGSEDDTQTVALVCGAKVVEFTWCDDFAAARNASLDAAACDWILVLDADEVLDPVSREEFCQLLEEPAVAGYELTISSLRVDQEQDFPLVRLFRNDPAVRFQFPIHEQIIPSLNEWAAQREMTVASSPLVIRHSGYGPSERAAKRPRNRRILAKALAEYPAEPYLHFQAGAEGVSLLDGEVLPVAGMHRAKVSLDKAWSLTEAVDDEAKKRLPWLPDLMALLGSASMVAGQTETARTLLTEGTHLFPDHAGLNFQYCLAFPGKITEAMPQVVALDPLLQHRILGEHALVQGDLHPAARHFRQALALDGEYTFALLGMANCSRAVDQSKEALSLYLQAVAASEWNWRAWQEGADLMEQLGLADQARSWRMTFCKQFPEHPVNKAV